MFKTKKVNIMFFLSSTRISNGAAKISSSMEEEVENQAILAMELETLQIVAINSLEEHVARPIMIATLKLVSFLANLKLNHLDTSGHLANLAFG